MARTQAQSGGIAQAPASYPVYAEISSSTAAVSAVINTGPSFIGPEGYDAWQEGPHIIVLPRAKAIATGAGTLRIQAGGTVAVWNGSAWAEKPVKVWSGSAWVEKPVKHWDGSTW